MIKEQMTTTKHYISIIVIWLAIVPSFMRADVMQEVNAYIDAMANGTPLEDQGHCGFRYQFWLRQHLHELSPDRQMMVKSLMERPERTFSAVSPNGHFRFHYDLEGTHAIPSVDQKGNGIPDYVDSAAVIFDHVWEVEIDGLGFQPPLGPDGKPVAVYDIYFSRLASTLYGQTWLEDPIENVPDTWTSYIEVNTRLDSPFLYTGGLDGLRVTAAHEFNHAIQLGYRAWEDENENLTDLFLMEMTSTWLEEYVYDAVNDYYQYLPVLFNNIQRTRFTSPYGTFPYGNGIYLQMLELDYGPGIVVDIWKRIRQETGMPAMEYVLNTYGTSWAVSQNQYARWMYYTGTRAIPGLFFPEAADYPMVTLNDQQQLILNDLVSLEYEMKAKTLGFIALENAADIRYRAQLKGSGGGAYYSHSTLSNTLEKPGRAGIAQAFYPGAGDTILVALSNPLDSAVTMTYSMEEDTVIFPGIGANPVVVSSDEDGAHFYNVPPEATIRIFNIQGRFVQVLRTGAGKAIKLSWNLQDQSGNAVSTGIYLYSLQAPGQEKVGKFAVVRR